MNKIKRDRNTLDRQERVGGLLLSAPRGVAPPRRCRSSRQRAGRPMQITEGAFGQGVSPHSRCVGGPPVRRSATGKTDSRRTTRDGRQETTHNEWGRRQSALRRAHRRHGSGTRTVPERHQSGTRRVPERPCDVHTAALAGWLAG